MARSEYVPVERNVSNQQLDAADASSDDESIDGESEGFGRDVEVTVTAGEAEGLLGKSLKGSEKLSGIADDVHATRHVKRGSKRRRKSEKAEPMYEMEEGGPRSSSAESSVCSSEADLAILHEAQGRQKVATDNVDNSLVIVWRADCQ